MKTMNRVNLFLNGNFLNESPARNVSYDDEAELHLNFRGAPLEAVFEYLRKAAGFFIRVKSSVDVNRRVDACHNRPISRDEALKMIQLVLQTNGYIAIRDGRNLTIINSRDIKKSYIPLPTRQTIAKAA